MGLWILNSEILILIKILINGCPWILRFCDSAILLDSSGLIRSTFTSSIYESNPACATLNLMSKGNSRPCPPCHPPCHRETFRDTGDCPSIEVIASVILQGRRERASLFFQGFEGLFCRACRLACGDRNFPARSLNR